MFLLAVTQASNNDKLVTDMQNKLTEIQQHELEFLNNFITHLGWIFGGVVSVIGIIAIYIGYANRQAEKKMKDAEKVLGEAEAVRLALIQDQADLTAYREEIRREFLQLTSLVNSEEITNLKKDIAILSVTSQIRNNYEEVQRVIDAGWKDYNTLLQNGKFDLISEYKQCKLAAITIRKKINLPIVDLTKANELLEESIKWREKASNAVTKLHFDAELLRVNIYMKEHPEELELPDE